MQIKDEHLIAIAVYVCLLIFSATANLYVFGSILRLRKHGKLGRVKLLILNLTVADLAVTFVMMPIEISWNATVSWRAGDLACRILSFFRFFGLYLSGFVLICICLDRYIAVMKPFAICEARRRNKKLLFAAWTASICCSLPQSFIFHVERYPESDWHEQCVNFNSFSSAGYELAYNLCGFFLMYVLPMGTILFCYSRILCKIYGITRKNINGLRRSSDAAIERAKTKTLKMTVTTVVIYFICWTPHSVISLWYWFDKSSATQLNPILQKILFAFACTNSCMNPLIYGYFHGGTRARNDSESTPLRPIPLIRLSGGIVNSNFSLHPLVQHHSCFSSLDGDSSRTFRLAESPVSSLMLTTGGRRFSCQCDLHSYRTLSRNETCSLRSSLDGGITNGLLCPCSAVSKITLHVTNRNLVFPEKINVDSQNTNCSKNNIFSSKCGIKKSKSYSYNLLCKVYTEQQDHFRRGSF